ncbi:MAG: alanine--glyoxylate aminotransferase family protein [Actinomycetes bacterium]
MSGQAPNPFNKKILATAGPTPLPPRVSSVMSEPVLYHRDPAFAAIYERVLNRLPEVFQTSNDVLLFASTGSGAMESAVSNLVQPGQKVLACATGKFGERWLQLLDAQGAETVRYEPGWGVRIDADEVDRLLTENPGCEVVFATLSETSTGVVHDVEAIAAVAKKHGALTVVDAVSGLGAAELRQDAWGIDVVVSGSQKALMAPPGVGLASVSAAALARAESQPGGRYYFDWGRTAKAQRKSPPSSPFTAPVTIVSALDVALDMIHEEGIENVFARHALLAKATRAGVAALDLNLYGDPDERSNVVTALELPSDIDGGKVPKILRDQFGITANGGQDDLKGKILRIAHCGYFGAFDILTSLAGLELTLETLGHSTQLGAGVGAAQRVFLDAGVSVTA